MAGHTEGDIKSCWKFARTSVLKRRENKYYFFIRTDMI
jgi:hypothetical protein